MENTKLTFVNVGYGEAVLFQCAGKRPFNVLIDGGSAEAAEYRDRSGGRMPLTEYLCSVGINNIDVLISTHIHEDHICAALQAARLFPPKELWQTLPPAFHHTLRTLDTDMAKTPSQSKFLRALNAYGELCDFVESYGGTIRQIAAGYRAKMCLGLNVYVLAPSWAREDRLRKAMEAIYAEMEMGAFFSLLDAADRNMNNFSLILLFDYFGTRILLPGDTNCRGYDGLAPQDLNAHIFKVGHHGQRDGLDENLIKAVRPKAMVCCASSDRRYESADPELLRIAAANGASLYFSDCPKVQGLNIPHHCALTCTLGTGGNFKMEYVQGVSDASKSIPIPQS